MKRVVLSLIAAAGVSATPANAEYSSPMHLDKWQVVQLGQCKAILNMGAFRLGPSGTKDESDWDIKKTEWTGACDSNGLITGPGVIRLYTWIQEPDGRYFTNYYHEYRVTAVNGMPDGPVTMATANYDDRRGGYEPAETWTEEPGYRRRFEGGCLIDEWQETGCDPAAGARFRQQYLGQRASVPVAITPIATPRPVAITPVTSGGGTSADQVTRLVSNGLMQLLGAGGAKSFGTKEQMISSVLASLSSALSGNSSPIATQPGLADTILGMVAGELSRSTGDTTTGQIIDLVNKVIGSALQSGPGASTSGQQALAAPVAANGGAMAGGIAADQFALNPAALIQAFGQLGKSVVQTGSNANFVNFKEANNSFNASLYCPSGGQCTAVQMRACYSYPNASVGRANAFNKEYLFGRAFIADNGNICIDQLVPGEGGFVSVQNFAKAYSVFDEAIKNAATRFNAP